MRYTPEPLTRVDGLVGASDLDVDKVDLELLLRLHTNQQWRTTAGGDDLVGVVARLEDESERALELLQDSLDKLSKADALVGVRVVNVLREDGNGLSVGFALELVPALLKDKAERVRVGDNPVVHDSEVCLRVTLERVAVDDRWWAVRRPTRVGNGHLREEGLRRVQVRLGDLLAKTGHLADLLEEKHLAGLVAINADAGGVVSTVLLTC